MRPGPPVSVLHVAQSSEYGLGRYLEALVAAQAAKGWEVAVAGNPASALRPPAEAVGATWLAWEAQRSPGAGVPGEVRRLGALVERAGPDIVHLHSSKAGLAGRAALRGRLPTIFQPHAWSFYALEPPLRQAAVAWERLAARWAQVVVCGSEEELEVGRRARIRARWRLVRNAVDVG
ncbi:MAG: glycosyltransferase, partial [Actinomycetota bacterium]|nr:glycosyltransferase [Actinomycetota bacterium]